MKFRFPNKHDVYMHDTPTKNLFNAEVRTFSHGCMRVREPQRLAELVLAEDQDWTASRVAAAINGGPQNNQITLSRKVPVHITYFTAMIDRAGELKLFPDIYGHEARIALGMEGKAHLIARLVKEDKPPARRCGRQPGGDDHRRRARRQQEGLGPQGVRFRKQLTVCYGPAVATCARGLETLRPPRSRRIAGIQSDSFRGFEGLTSLELLRRGRLERNSSQGRGTGHSHARGLAIRVRERALPTRHWRHSHDRRRCDAGAGRGRERHRRPTPRATAPSPSTASTPRRR